MHAFTYHCGTLTKLMDVIQTITYRGSTTVSRPCIMVSQTSSVLLRSSRGWQRWHRLNLNQPHSTGNEFIEIRHQTCLYLAPEQTRSENTQLLDAVGRHYLMAKLLKMDLIRFFYSVAQGEKGVPGEYMFQSYQFLSQSFSKQYAG